MYPNPEAPLKLGRSPRRARRCRRSLNVSDQPRNILVRKNARWEAELVTYPVHPRDVVQKAILLLSAGTERRLQLVKQSCKWRETQGKVAES